MPTRPYKEHRSTYKPNGLRLHERVNNPDSPTDIAEVVVDIIREENETKSKRKRASFLVPMVSDPCAASPTTAHWWLYPAQGKRGQPWCRYCGEYK